MCGISAISFHCFMSESKVLMTVTNFFFSRNRFLEEGFTIQWGASFLSAWGGQHPLGASALVYWWEEFSKKKKKIRRWWGVSPMAHYGKPWDLKHTC